MIALGVVHEPGRAGGPRFQAGQRVRARNINPSATRACRATPAANWARSIATMASLFSRTPTPNSSARNPQHVYSVRFSARELWGEQAKPRDTVYILTMWDDYLEPA